MMNSASRMSKRDDVFEVGKKENSIFDHMKCIPVPRTKPSSQNSTCHVLSEMSMKRFTYGNDFHILVMKGATYCTRNSNSPCAGCEQSSILVHKFQF